MAKPRRDRRPSRRPHLERLEGRELLSTVTVSDLGDADNGHTLRSALIQANASPVPTSIVFSVVSPGPWTVRLSSALPTITRPVTIDGSASGGYIILDGSQAGASVNGLTIDAAGVSVTHMAIDHFNGAGIEIDGPGGDSILHDAIGIDPYTNLADGNAGAGIRINGAPANVIGNASGGQNLISGNAGPGIAIQGGTAIGNQVLGNFIGTDLTAKVSVPNFVGVWVSGAPQTVVGQNYVSGNTGTGIYVGGSGSSGTKIVGNLVGVDVSGAKALANTGDGIDLIDVPGVTVGGASTNQPNQVSGNGLDGIFIGGSGSTGDVVTGNAIGLDQARVGAIPNAGAGVEVGYAAPSGDAAGSPTGITIGGTSASSGNFISGNAGAGVSVSGPTAGPGDLIAANWIGLNTQGLAAGNGGDGVSISGVSNPNTIGGTSGNARNVISGNVGSGITLANGSDLVEGNAIGTDPSGSQARPNGGSGIAIASAGNTIGGGLNSNRNLIAGNTGAGVLIAGTGSSNSVFGNFIGVPYTSNTPLPNQDGVVIAGGAHDNTIGGAAGFSNIVSGNARYGVSITATGPGGNIVQDNSIGVDYSGSIAIANGGDGVLIAAPASTPGGRGEVVSGNIVSGNAGNGITLRGPGVSSTSIVANTVGLDIRQSKPIANRGDGVAILGASGTTIGGTALLANVIAGNTQDGIALQADPTSGAQANGSLIQGNWIGSNGPGATGLGNRSGISGLGAQQTLVRGNYIGGNLAGGVTLGSGRGNVLLGNLLGTDSTGEFSVPNRGAGITLSGEQGDVVGGPNPADRNVIANSAGPGIAATSTTSLVVSGNTIGLDLAGTRRMINYGDGIDILNGSGTVIGGSSAGQGNLISSNMGFGVNIVGPIAGTTFVFDNLIGVDKSGNNLAGNALDGIVVTGASAAIVANTVDANGQNGITLHGSSGSVIVGNQVGHLAAGTGNLGIGIMLDNSSGNTIGGSSGASSNVIASNGNVGIYISNGSANNVLQGNKVGLDLNGYGGHGNADGIVVRDSPGTTIGGTSAGGGNLVGSNAVYGIDVSGSKSVGTMVVGNVVGLEAGGDYAAPNGADGIIIDNAPGVQVWQNVVSGNLGAGVQAVGTGSTGGLIRSNIIGLNGAGRSSIGNGRGVILNDASSFEIGGNTPGSRNLIAANSDEGILILGASATRNRIQGNWIGLNATGQGVLGNGTDGILIVSPNNVVGGTDASTRNVIAGSHSVGVHILGGSATGNLVSANWIGLDATGSKAAGSGIVGVLLDGAPRNQVGGPSFASGNVITGSGVADVDISGPASASNLVSSNFVGTDGSGTIGLSGAPYGILLDGSVNNTIGGGSGNLIGGHRITGVALLNGATGNVVAGNQYGPAGTGSPTLSNGQSTLVVKSPNNSVS